jgi:hypothetical protein
MIHRFELQEPPNIGILVLAMKYYGVPPYRKEQIELQPGPEWDIAIQWLLFNRKKATIMAVRWEAQQSTIKLLGRSPQNTMVCPDCAQPMALPDFVQAKIDDLQRWKDTVQEIALVHWCFSDENAENPRELINAVISSNVNIALDPIVSEEARKLIARGRNER